ncbi:MAG: Fur family transcriptional regulator [Coriobacteriia bacterium]
MRDKPGGEAAASLFASKRITSQRRAIMKAIEAMGVAFTTDELIRVVRTGDTPLAPATVYRAIAELESTGWLERVGQRAGSVLYARCNLSGCDHHHHLVCDHCGRVEATPCPLSSDVIADGGAGNEGFRVTRHEVTLYGLCAECARKGA